MTEKKEFLNDIDINAIKSRPLSNKDISKLLYKDKQNKAVLYKDLYNCNDIMELFDDDDKILMLLPVASHSNGHWINIIYNRKKKCICYNDSYGLKPEHFKTWLTPQKIQQLGIGHNVLHELLLKAQDDGHNIKVNKTRYQQYNEQTNNCGRHCVLKCRLKSLSDAKYNKLLKDTQLSYDDAVCLLTFNDIGY